MRELIQHHPKAHTKDLQIHFFLQINVPLFYVCAGQSEVMAILLPQTIQNISI